MSSPSPSSGSPMQCNHPDCKPLGPCPQCGTEEAGDWVDGYHGWVCGSKNAGLHGEAMRIIQSKECYAAHWRRKAERLQTILDGVASLTRNLNS